MSNIYNETIAQIKATESFKNKIIIKLQEESCKLDFENAAPKHKHNLNRIFAAAACIVVIAGAAILFSVFQNNQTEQPQSLQKLTIVEDKGGYGCGDGYLAYSIDDLKNSNPWSIDANLKTLPVFKNTAVADPGGDFDGGLTGDEMMEKAKEAAKALGFTVNKVYTRPSEEDIESYKKSYEKKTGKAEIGTDFNGKPIYSVDDPYIAIAECDEGQISVEPNGTVSIASDFNIPYEYNFSETATPEQTQKTLSYLIDKFSDLIDMKKPIQNVISDYSIDGVKYTQYYVFEGKGNLTDRILGYNFNTVSFLNDGSKLVGIRCEDTNLSEKIGDYPIITVDEAKSLLFSGHYNSVAEYIPKDESCIEKVELVYSTHSYNDVFMPFYKYIIETRDDNGLKTFDCYYVPAVEWEYITNMPMIK